MQLMCIVSCHGEQWSRGLGTFWIMLWWWFSTGLRAAPLVQGMECAAANGYVACLDGFGLEALCFTPAPPYGSNDCGSCGVGGAALCSTSAALSIVNTTWTTLCSPRGTLLVCPPGQIVVSTCGTVNTPCQNASVCPDSSGVFFGAQCAPASGLTVHATTCEWRFGNSNGLVGCNSGEVMIGICNGPAQGDCGGAPYGTAAQCCINVSSACAPEEQFKYVAFSETCDDSTAVYGFCAVDCDPYGYYGFRSNPGMFACTGWVPTQSLTVTTSSCATRAYCAAGTVVTAIGQCYVAGFGAGTTVTCAALAFGSVSASECVWLQGSSTVLWCPAGYIAVAACGPNSVSGCPSGQTTELLCCQYTAYHNLGQPCPAGFAYSLTAQADTGAPAPYGADLTTPLSFVSLGQVSGAFYCSDTLYVTSNASSVLYYLSLSQLRANITMGSFGVAGFTQSPWNPSLWSARDTLLEAPTDVITRAVSPEDSSGCASPLFIDSGSFIIVDILAGAVSSSTFLASILVGSPSTSPGTVVNGSGVYAATLPTMNSVAYCSTSDTFYVTVAGAVLQVLPPTTPSGNGAVYYWQGNGVPGATADNVFRTLTQVWNPQQIIVVDSTMVYFTDYDGVSPGGSIIATTIETGITGPLPGLPPTIVPYGIAYYTGLSGLPRLFISDRTNHAIWQYNLVTGLTTLVSAQPGLAGITNRVVVSQLRLDHPGRLSAGDTRLWIVDEGNQRVVQYNIEAQCDPGYDPAANCLACTNGYEGYPRCRQACSNSADCSSRASSVTGSPGTACLCACAGNYAGTSCSYCHTGYDPRSNCTRCLYGYAEPMCRTRTVTKSSTLLLTETSLVTLSQTVTQPPRATPTPPPTSSTTVTSTTTLPRTQTKKATNTWSLSRTPSRPRSSTRLLTVTRTITVTVPVTVSRSQSSTIDETASVTRSLRRTASPSVEHTSTVTQTRTWFPSESATPSHTLIDTRTETILITATPTSSYALLLPRLLLLQPSFLSMYDLASADPSRRLVVIGIEYGFFDNVSGGNTCVGVGSTDQTGITFAVDPNASSCTQTECVAQLMQDSSADVAYNGYVNLNISSRCLQCQPKEPLILPVPVLLAPHDAFVPRTVSAIWILTGTAAGIAVGWASATPSLLIAHSQASFYTTACAWGVGELFGVSLDMSPTGADFASDPATSAAVLYSLVFGLAGVIAMIAAHYAAEQRQASFASVVARWQLLGRLCGSLSVPFIVSVTIVVSKAAQSGLQPALVALLIVLWTVPLLLVCVVVSRNDWRFEKESLLAYPSTVLGRSLFPIGRWAHYQEPTATHMASNFLVGYTSPINSPLEIILLLLTASCAAAALSVIAPNCDILLGICVGAHVIRGLTGMLHPQTIPVITWAHQLHSFVLAIANFLSLLWSLGVLGNNAQRAAEYCSLLSMLFGLAWLAWFYVPLTRWRRARATDAFNLHGDSTCWRDKRLLVSSPPYHSARCRDPAVSSDDTDVSDGGGGERMLPIPYSTSHIRSVVNPLPAISARSSPWSRFVASDDDVARLDESATRARRREATDDGESTDDMINRHATRWGRGAHRVV